MLGFYKPTRLRGDVDRNRYFEGWFQKVCSVKHRVSFVIIYGYATQNSHDTFGFIQLLVPDQAPRIVYFSKDEISCDSERHIVRMGDNVLSTESIAVDSNDISIQLTLMDNQPIQTFKNSMGYTYFVPNLPCYHSVLNTAHRVSGEIRCKDSAYLLEDDLGYMEKNWGTSFPENYVWLHAVDPHDPQVSLLFSQAEIKWLGRTFVRHVGHCRFDGNEIDLRDLKNVTVAIVHQSNEQQTIRITSSTVEIEISIVLGVKVKFKGPMDGTLSRDILHYTDAVINLRVSQNGTTRTFRLIGNCENVGSTLTMNAV